MKLTTRGRYAVTAMLDLTLHLDDAPCSLGAVAARQNLPRNYLEQLFARLRRYGLVNSIRGNEGGYTLSRPATEISVADILSAVDKPIDVTRCAGKGNCQNGYTCLTHHLWEDLSHRMQAFLADISLAQLSKRNEVLAVHCRQSVIAARNSTNKNFSQTL